MHSKTCGIIVSRCKKEMIGFIVSVLFLLFCLGCVIHTIAGGGHKSTTTSDNKTRYSQSRNFIDFDAGTDSDKVGNPNFPNAGIDNVMKHEFMDNLLNDKQ